MRSSISLRFAAVLAGFALAGTFGIGAPQAQAHSYTVGNIEVVHPWARPSTVKTGATYFQLINKGKSDDALMEVKGDVADKIEVHTMTMDNNIMRMRKVDRLALPAGKTVAIEPGGLHIMLIGLKKPLVVGEKFPLHLVFEKAGGVDVVVHVQAKPPVTGDDMKTHGDSQMDDHSHDHDHDHSQMDDHSGMTMPDASGSMMHH